MGSVPARTCSRLPRHRARRYGDEYPRSFDGNCAVGEKQSTVHTMASFGGKIVSPRFDAKLRIRERYGFAVLQVQRGCHAVHPVEHEAQRRHGFVENSGSESAMKKPRYPPMLGERPKHGDAPVAVTAKREPEGNRIVVATTETFPFHPTNSNGPPTPEMDCREPWGRREPAGSPALKAAGGRLGSSVKQCRDRE